MQKSAKRAYVFHPFLFAIFFILFLYSDNIHLLLLKGILFPLFLSLTVAFGLWVLLRYILKNEKKAGFLVSLTVLVFFSYGHFFNLITGEEQNLGFEKEHLLIIYLALLGLGAYYFVKTKRKLDNATLISNGIAITMIVLVGINIISFNVDSFALFQDFRNTEENSLSLTTIVKKPDVYYILLDGYANAVILNDYLGYDNHEFIDFLIKKKFYVTDEYTFSNYPWTSLTIPSVLNMNYVNNISTDFQTKSQRQAVLYEMINQNSVMRNFKSMNYTVINFDSMWWGDRNIKIADENLCQDLFIDFRFLLALERTTILSANKYIDKEITPLLYGQKRQKILCEFSELEKIRDRIEGPIFAYVHIMAPHPPFVFDDNGMPVNVQPKKRDIDGLTKAYLNQLKFINGKTEVVLEQLLSKNKDPPIIVIQSDHGTRVVPENSTDEESVIIRYGNFYAYYFPQSEYDLDLKTVTPVNTFRQIFNNYFDGEYELLDELLYRSKGDYREFINATNILRDFCWNCN